MRVFRLSVAWEFPSHHCSEQQVSAGHPGGLPIPQGFRPAPPHRAVWPGVKMKIDHGGKAAWPRSQPGVAETPAFIIILSVTQPLY